MSSFVSSDHDYDYNYDYSDEEATTEDIHMGWGKFIFAICCSLGGLICLILFFIFIAPYFQFGNNTG